MLAKVLYRLTEFRSSPRQILDDLGRIPVQLVGELLDLLTVPRQALVDLLKHLGERVVDVLEALLVASPRVGDRLVVLFERTDHAFDAVDKIARQHQCVGRPVAGRTNLPGGASQGFRNRRNLPVGRLDGVTQSVEPIRERRHPGQNLFTLARGSIQALGGGPQAVERFGNARCRLDTGTSQPLRRGPDGFAQLGRSGGAGGSHLFRHLPRGVRHYTGYVAQRLLERLGHGVRTRVHRCPDRRQHRLERGAHVLL